MFESKNKKTRFEAVFQERMSDPSVSIFILRDTHTGVHYLANQYGLTPLLDKTGDVIVEASSSKTDDNDNSI